MQKKIVLMFLASAAILANPVMAMPNEKRLQEYYLVDEGGKCGYIDAAGRYIIPAKYDRASSFRKGLASVTVGYDTHFIDPSGKIVFSLPDRMRSFGFDDRDDTAEVESRTGRGFIDMAGTVVVPAVFTKVRPFGGELSDDKPFSDHSTTTVQLDNSHWAVIDRTGRILFGPRRGHISIFDDGVYRAWNLEKQSDEYFGRDFKLLTTYKPTMRYDLHGVDERKFNSVHWHRSGYAEAQLLGDIMTAKKGILNSQGQWAVQPTYDELYFNEDRDELTYIHGRRGSKWGFIDISGKEVIPFAFDDLAPFVGNHAPAAIGNRWGLIDRSGQWKLQPKYDEVDELSDVAVAVKQGSLWGVMDYSGRWLIEPKFVSVGYCQGRDFTMAEHMFKPEDSPMVKQFEGVLGGFIEEMDKKSNSPK